MVTDSPSLTLNFMPPQRWDENSAHTVSFLEIFCFEKDCQANLSSVKQPSKTRSFIYLVQLENLSNAEEESQDKSQDKSH